MENRNFELRIQTIPYLELFLILNDLLLLQVLHDHDQWMQQRLHDQDWAAASEGHDQPVTRFLACPCVLGLVNANQMRN